MTIGASLSLFLIVPLLASALAAVVPTKPPMLSANTVSPVPAWDQER